MSTPAKWLLGALGAVVLVVVVVALAGPRVVQDNLAQPDPDPDPPVVLVESEDNFCAQFVGTQAAPGLNMRQRVADPNLHWTIPQAAAPTQALADSAWEVWSLLGADSPLTTEAAVAFDAEAQGFCYQ